MSTLREYRGRTATGLSMHTLRTRFLLGTCTREEIYPSINTSVFEGFSAQFSQDIGEQNTPAIEWLIMDRIKRSSYPSGVRQYSQ